MKIVVTNPPRCYIGSKTWVSLTAEGAINTKYSALVKQWAIDKTFGLRSGAAGSSPPVIIMIMRSEVDKYIQISKYNKRKTYILIIANLKEIGMKNIT